VDFPEGKGAEALRQVQVLLLEQAEVSKEVENMTPQSPHPPSWGLATRLRIMWGNPRGFESAASESH
jgi:hypothetical protein